jgi:uncharacterized protein
MRVKVAKSHWDRLRGLSWRRNRPAYALLLARTRSVHTFGMRFALDLYWLDERGVVLRVDRAVPPRRLRRCAGAAAVLEVPSSGAG